MGFVVFMVMGVYVLISFGTVALAVSYAKKRGKSTICWGLSAALVMYLIPCWDWIPTVVAHKYYCEKEAGFWVYKTLDQWKAENPGVLEILTTQRVPQNKFEQSENVSISTTIWNTRIYSTHKTQGPFFPNLWSREDEILDAKTGGILARYMDFSTSQERRQAGWSGWKFWLDSEDCIGGRDKAIRFVKFVEQLKGAEK
ncbi:conserved hypothetical protein, membrane [sediment metagenome]|uniref:Uncharacterized protein n=1 Tax=sediment metagenome TaxID=749907 RepID=D9PJJ4_9ZZZZ